MPESAPGLIPDGRVVRGTGSIRRAWLAEPTAEYDHGILGDGIEAAALKVETADGVVLSVPAPVGTVFEDLSPRLWDIDGDGDAEAWVIRSGPGEGGRLEAYSVQQGKLALRFATASLHADVRLDVLVEVEAQIKDEWAWQMLLEFFEDPESTLRHDAFEFSLKKAKKERRRESLAAALKYRYADLRLASVKELTAFSFNDLLVALHRRLCVHRSADANNCRWNSNTPSID